MDLTAFRELTKQYEAILVFQAQTLELVQELKQENTNIMAAIGNIITAQAAEKADLATLGPLITQLLTAFANGSMTPTQAAAVLAEINAEDTTVKGNISAIQAALGTTIPPVNTGGTP